MKWYEMIWMIWINFYLWKKIIQSIIDLLVIIWTFARPNTNGQDCNTTRYDFNAHEWLQCDKNEIQANNPLKSCKQREIMNYELWINNYELNLGD